MTSEPHVKTVERVLRSSRDPSALAARLSEWLSTVQTEGGTPAVEVHASAEANGMSSETVLFSARWDGDSSPTELVARVQPRPEDVPVFPTYRLDHQFAVMKRAAELSDVPIPTVRWYEHDESVLGTRFFVMDRVDGRIPPDVMPYPLGDNWLFDATPDQQRALQDQSVDLLAGLHSIPDPSREFDYLLDGPDTDALRQHFRWIESCYEFGIAEVGRSQLIDDCFAWLERNWALAHSTSDNVLLWGDARIGNVIYSEFTPVAVLDWEMTAVGPRELDVAWMIFAHVFFEQIAKLAGLPGMPNFMQENEVRSRYRAKTGVDLGDLRWFCVYSGLMWCVFMLRTGARRVHFGEMEMPEDIELLFYHATVLREMISTD